MIEVEVKAKIDSFEEMEERLSEIGAQKTKKEFQEDIYFNSPVVDFADTDEALRIRTTTENDNTNIFITYKGPKIDQKSKTRKEVEMKIEDSKKCSDIFFCISSVFISSGRASRRRFLIPCPTSFLHSSTSIVRHPHDRSAWLTPFAISSIVSRRVPSRSKITSLYIFL